jgi:hypothetical protein
VLTSTTLSAWRPGSSLSRLIVGLCLLLALAIPVFALVALLGDWPRNLERALQAIGPAAQSFNQLRLELQILVVALLVVPAIVMGACLVEAARCLRTLRGPGSLSGETVRRLRVFAALMFASVVAGLVVQPIAGVIVSLAGTGKGTLSLGMSSQQAILVVFALVTWQIARAMEAAVAVADEYAQIV